MISASEELTSWAKFSNRISRNPPLSLMKSSFGNFAGETKVDNDCPSLGAKAAM